MKYLSSGACLLVAVFCAYGFLASGEYTGAQKLAWQSGYAIAGLVMLTSGLWIARRN